MHQHRSNLGLDVVRAGAILAVLFSHSYEWWIGASRASEIIAAFVGNAGVEVFFSLSGFLIGGILLRVGETGLDGPALRRFWTRRWLRTLPAYWVMLGLLNWRFGTWDWYTPLFLQNFADRALWTPLTIHTWSLVLEEWFYLFVPPMFALALFVGRRSRWAVPAVCATLIVASALARAWVQAHPAPFWGPEPASNPLLRLDCAAWGVLAACWVRHRAGLGRRPTSLMPASLMPAWLLIVGGLAGLGLLFAIFVRSFTPELLLPYGFLAWGNAYLILRPSLIELFAAGIVLGMRALLPAGSGALAWTAGATARLSYALYLVHVPVLFLLRGAGFDDAADWGVRGLMAASVLAAAMLMRVGVELPVLALRDRFAPEPGRPPKPLFGTGWQQHPACHLALQRLDRLGDTLARPRTATLIAAAACLAALAAFAVRARVGLVTLEFGDETEKYVAAAMLRHGGRLYADIFANHGPLAYALAWLTTFVTGAEDFTRTRLVVVAFALAACAAVVASPALPRRGPAQLWAATLFLAPISAFWFVHPLHMLIYHALGGYLLTIALAQLTVPAVMGLRIGPWGARVAGAATVLACTAAYPFAVPGALFLAAAALGLWAAGRSQAVRPVAAWVLAGGAAAAIPMAAWITWKADWTGLYVYHFYFNQVVYARINGFSLLGVFQALELSFSPLGRVHAFAVIAGALGLLALIRFRGPLAAQRLAAVIPLAFGLLMLNPRGSFEFPDTAQVIACLGLLALLAAGRLSAVRGLPLLAGLAAVGVYVAGSEHVARTALVSPHGMMRSQAPRVFLKPDPSEGLAREIRKLVPEGGTFLGLPFMPATYIFAARLPASGAYYYLPVQAEYDKNPILGRTIDLCADIRRNRPPALIVSEIPSPIWGTIFDYKPCLGPILSLQYAPVPGVPKVYARRDRTP